MSTASVLVVDDETAVLGFVSKVLSSSGYKVVTANGGNAALEIVSATGPFDLVASEMDLDGTHFGPHLFHSVKQAAPSTALLVISDWRPDETEKLPPGTGFLRKPFTPEGLITAVQQSLAWAAEARKQLAASIERAEKLHAESDRLVSETCDVARKIKKNVEALCEKRRSRKLEMAPQGSTERERLFDTLLDAIVRGDYDEAQKLMDKFLSR